MTDRELRSSIDDLLAGRSPRGFTPSEFEAAQLRTAIELAANRPGADTPSPEFVDTLKTRLAEQMSDGAAPRRGMSATRRHVIIGTAAAATAAVAAASVDRLLGSVNEPDDGGELTPTDGAWRAVADSSALTEGAVRAFDLGSVKGFVRRVDGEVKAVSGICTHQGCALWFDQGADRLRCPCHLTSFSPAGQVVTHALPVAPKPLPQFEVREHNGMVEVLAPPSQPA